MKISAMVIMMVLTLFTLVFAQEKHEPGVILLKVMQPGVFSIVNNQAIGASPQLQSVLRRYPIENSRKLVHVDSRTDGVYRLEFPINAPLDSIRIALAACPDVTRANFNRYGILASAPDDEHWPDQWVSQKIGMADGWDISTGDNSILIGVMDSGIEIDHEDLVGSLWQNLKEDADGDGHTLEFIDGEWQLDPGDLDGDDDDNYDANSTTYKDDLIGWDFVDNDNDPTEVSGGSDHHGTRTSGVIAARSNNAIGVAGIAGGWGNQSGVNIISLKIAENVFGIWTEERARAALLYLTDLRRVKGIPVIANMSLQTKGISDEPMEELADAVLSADEEGVIMVAAAGNTVSDPGSPYNDPDVFALPIPARYFKVMAIGASTDGSSIADELRSSYSLYDDEANQLLIVAPVDDHVTTGINLYTTYKDDGYVNWFNGTSAAAPVVTGVIALMLSVDPNLTRTGIEDILKSTATKIGPYTYTNGRTPEVGHGRINAKKALSKANGNPSTVTNLTVFDYGGNPKLTWTGVIDADLLRYRVDRISPDANSYYVTGTSFVDDEIEICGQGTARYKVVTQDWAGLLSAPTAEVTIGGCAGKTIAEDVIFDGTIPEGFALHDAHPNPFNPSTTIRYDLPQASRVSLTIYDMLGREVRSWTGEEPAGYGQVVWDGTDQSGRAVPTGVYIYRLVASANESGEPLRLSSGQAFIASRKMILMK